MSDDKKRVGRPTNAELAEAGKKGDKPGPKPGHAAILADYKARMIASPKSRKVLKKILDAGLDDDHKHQAVAWKIIADRLLPLSAFDPKKGGGNGVNISINVSGVDTGDNGQTGILVEAEETEYEEVTEEDDGSSTNT